MKTRCGFTNVASLLAQLPASCAGPDKIHRPRSKAKPYRSMRASKKVEWLAFRSITFGTVIRQTTQRLGSVLPSVVLMELTRHIPEVPFPQHVAREDSRVLPKPCVPTLGIGPLDRWSGVCPFRGGLLPRAIIAQPIRPECGVNHTTCGC